MPTRFATCAAIGTVLVATAAACWSQQAASSPTPVCWWDARDVRTALEHILAAPDDAELLARYGEFMNREGFDVPLTFGGTMLLGSSGASLSPPDRGHETWSFGWQPRKVGAAPRQRLNLDPGRFLIGYGNPGLRRLDVEGSLDDLAGLVVAVGRDRVAIVDFSLGTVTVLTTRSR